MTYKSWEHDRPISERSYQCGHCDKRVGSDRGYSTERGLRGRIYICPSCGRPTFFSDGLQLPGPMVGNSVGHLPQVIEALFHEMRQSFSVGAYTGVLLIGRKILMNVSVDQGAEENKSFQFYVNFLDEKNIVPAGGKIWIDHIRQMGNEATHEIPQSDKKKATEVISFCEMLLKIVFEFPRGISQGQ